MRHIFISLVIFIFSLDTYSHGANILASAKYITQQQLGATYIAAGSIMILTSVVVVYLGSILLELKEKGKHE